MKRFIVYRRDNRQVVTYCFSPEKLTVKKLERTIPPPLTVDDCDIAEVEMNDPAWQVEDGGEDPVVSAAYRVKDDDSGLEPTEVLDDIHDEVDVRKQAARLDSSTASLVLNKTVDALVQAVSLLVEASDLPAGKKNKWNRFVQAIGAGDEFDFDSASAADLKVVKVARKLAIRRKKAIQ